MHQIIQQQQNIQVLPLQLSIVNNKNQNDLCASTLMRNKNNTDTQHQQYLTSLPLCSFSSFQQQQQQQQTNQKNFIINTKNLNVKNNSAAYCNLLMHSNNENIKDIDNVTKNQSKSINHNQSNNFNNLTNTYSIF